MSFVFENSKCYPSTEAITAETDCLSAGGIFVPTGAGSTSGSCYKTFAEIPSQASCQAALTSATAPDTTLWANGKCSDSGVPRVTLPSKITCPAGSTCIPTLDSTNTYSLKDPDTGGAFKNWGGAEWTFFVDMNKDGLIDIVTFNVPSNLVYVFYNLGTGFVGKKYGFSGGVVWDNSPISPQSYPCRLSDDILLSDTTFTTYTSTGGCLSWFPFAFSSGFSAAPQLISTWASGFNGWIGSYGGNSYGIASPNQGEMDIYFQGAILGANGQFQTYAPMTSKLTFPSTIWNPTTKTWVGTGNPWGPANYTWAADFNSDGKTEIVSAKNIPTTCSSTTSTINMFSLPTSGTVVTPTSCPGGGWGTSQYTFVGDFSGHGNGQQDILSACGQYLHLKTFKGSNCFTTALTHITKSTHDVRARSSILPW